MVERKELGRGGGIDKGKEVDISKACSEGSEKKGLASFFFRIIQGCY